MVEALLNGLLGIAGTESGATGRSGGRSVTKSGDRSVAATGRSAGTESGATDPVLCLLLWAALLHSEGRIDPKLLKKLGVDAKMFEALSAKHPELLEQLRRLRLAGMLFSRESIATLLKARLSELLMGATKASELLAITKAMERMPDWAWGEERDAGSAACGSGFQPLGGRRLEAAATNGSSPAAEAALQQVRELLAGQFGEVNTVEQEALVEKQQRLADRLDDFLVAPRPQQKSSTRGGKRAPGKQRRR